MCIWSVIPHSSCMLQKCSSSREYVSSRTEEEILEGWTQCLMPDFLSCQLLIPNSIPVLCINYRCSHLISNSHYVGVSIRGYGQLSRDSLRTIVRKGCPANLRVPWRSLVITGRPDNTCCQLSNNGQGTGHGERRVIYSQREKPVYCSEALIQTWQIHSREQIMEENPLSHKRQREA